MALWSVLWKTVSAVRSEFFSIINYLKLKFLKFLKKSLQLRNQRKINLLFTLLSLPVYYLRYYHSVFYHFQFILYAIITFNLFFTLLSLCPLSLLISFLQIIWAKKSERFTYYTAKIQKPKTVKLQAFIVVTLLLKWPFIVVTRLLKWPFILG